MSFHHQVRPILQQHCMGCHQPARKQGRVDLTRFAALCASDEEMVVVDDPERSLLLEVVQAQGGREPEMPKDAAPLASTEVDILRRWIAEGARDDTPPDRRVVDAEHPPRYSRAPVVTAIDHSPDGHWLAVSGYHEVLLYALPEAQLSARWVGLSSRIEDLAFSPQGDRLAVVGGDPGLNGELQVWDVEHGTLAWSRSVTHDTLFGVSWSPDGRMLAFGGTDHTVRAVTADHGEEVLFQGAHEDWVLGTVFSLDGQHLVTVSRDRSMKLIGVPQQQFIDNITSITPGALKGGLMAVDRFPDRDELLVGGADGVARLYQMFRTKKREIGDDHNLLREFPAVGGRIFDVEVSTDGMRCAVGSSTGDRGAVDVFLESDGSQCFHLDVQSGIYALSLHPTLSSLAIGGFDGRVRILDTRTAELLHDFEVLPAIENLDSEESP